MGSLFLKRSAALVRLVFLLALASGPGACAQKDNLIGRPGPAPPGVDLSGRWQLRAGAENSLRQIGDAATQAAGGSRELIQLRRKKADDRSSRTARGMLVFVFLETGRRLKITQTEAGLFISFDRAIVEEYRFGEKREISVGEIEAQRVSGWEGDAYVIETLDKDGAKLIERYALRDGGTVLVRSITISARGEITLAISQLFDRMTATSQIVSGE